MIFGILITMTNVKRLTRVAIILKPATLLKLHKGLVHRKYRLLFSSKSLKKPGPKGPERAVIDLILEMKRRHPSYGYRRIAMQISNSLGCHLGIDGGTPLQKANESLCAVISIQDYRWEKQCHGLLQLPKAA